MASAGTGAISHMQPYKLLLVAARQDQDRQGPFVVEAKVILKIELRVSSSLGCEYMGRMSTSISAPEIPEGASKQGACRVIPCQVGQARPGATSHEL